MKMKKLESVYERIKKLGIKDGIKRLSIDGGDGSFYLELDCESFLNVAKGRHLYTLYLEDYVSVSLLGHYDMITTDVKRADEKDFFKKHIENGGTYDSEREKAE